ncbi:MAG: hypothetical protein RIS76_1769, partial [Verrucomicrobiota bacterium]
GCLPEGRDFRVPILPRSAPKHPTGERGKPLASAFVRAFTRAPGRGKILGTRTPRPSIGVRLPEGRDFRVPILPRSAPKHPTGERGKPLALEYAHALTRAPGRGREVGLGHLVPPLGCASRRDEIFESPFSPAALKNTQPGNVGSPSLQHTSVPSLTLREGGGYWGLGHLVPPLGSCRLRLT